MQAGLLGPSSQLRSLPQDAQRTVNLFAVLDQDGKTVGSLYSRPGLNLMASVGVGPGRGGIVSFPNGFVGSRVFVVSGATLYELFTDGTYTGLGNLTSSTGTVTMADNGFQLAICDGTQLYILRYTDNVFQLVTSPNLPSAASVIFLDGYFIVNKSVNSGIFQISAPYNGLTWAALDFATAESSPDALLRVVSINGQLWLYGVTTTEIWSNTGAANFPFQRVNSSARLSIGTISPDSVLELDNTAYWIGRNLNGFGIVYKADGFSPQRVSTDAIEIIIQKAPDPTTIRAFSYQENGHVYLILTGGGMETALVYELSTQIWSEWAYLNIAGNYELPLQSYLFAAFGKIIALDRTSGNVYIQSINYYSDNGDEIARDRIFTHIFGKGVRFLIKNLAIFFESGVGNSIDPGEDPKCQLSLSKDGGRSWFANYLGSIGKLGNFQERGVLFWRLGSYFQCTFRVRVTDPIKVVISGAEFNI